jgi:hypothetical protein
MRRSAALFLPLTLILLYYAFWIGSLAFLLQRFPLLAEYFPIGGIDDLSRRPCCPPRARFAWLLRALAP